LKNIILIGTGRLAWHLGPALKNAGHSIIQVLGRNPENTLELAHHLESKAIIHWSEMNSEADFYILAIPDQVLLNLASLIPLRDRFFIHCSGASPLNILSSLSSHIGVLYPMQTFSKEIELDFKAVPLFIESGKEEDLGILNTLAQSLSEFVYPMDSEKRAYIHLSAVFANNFTNHLVYLAEKLLGEMDISAQVLFPLVAETVRKILILGPEKAQTGPALRNDRITMNRHMELLNSFPELQKIYSDLSEDIIKTYKNES
jgi:predicted short-subunit dehydrogenase-like oxidoreductase (DUF2520 family)